MVKRKKLIKVRLHKERINRNTYKFTSARGRVIAITKLGKEKGKMKWMVAYGKEGRGIKRFKTVYTPSHYTHIHVLKHHYYR